MRLLTLGLIALFGLSACSKSVEGESRRWEQGQRKVEELGVLYPRFKDALEAQRQKAEAAMEAARSVGDEKQRIEEMAAANQLLSGGFVGQLAAVDASIKKIREQIVEVSGKAADESDRLSARQAAQGAERVLAEVKTTLNRGAGDPAAAAVLLKKVSSDLRAAENNLKRVARAVRDKQRAREAEEKAAKAADEAGTGQAGSAGAGEQAAQAWTCEYCDSASPADADTCHNCGAPRPGK